MKKIFTIRYAMAAMTAVALIATMATTSCSKTEELSGEKGNVITTINASAGGDDQTKVYFTPGSGNIFHVTWKTNDKITVINDIVNTSAVYTYGGTDNATRGLFSGNNLSANSGDQLFAFYNQYGTVNAADNSITVDYSNSGNPSSSVWQVDPSNEVSIYATNNSLMYASATAGASGTIPLLNFKNANAIVKLTFGSVTGDFNTLTFVSGDGGFPIKGKATVSVESGETKIKWSDLTYGGFSLSSGLSNFDFTKSYGNVVIPGTYGPLYYLISDDALATATSVYYINTSDKVSLVAGKSYGLSKTVARAAIVNSGGTIDDDTKDVWINQLPASSNNSELYPCLSNLWEYGKITLIQANTDATTATPLSDPFNGNTTSLYAYINNYSTTISDDMFRGCTYLRYVSLPNVTAIPANAFYQCSALKSLCLPSVTSVNGQNALGYCTSLTKLTFRKILTDADWSSSSLNVFNGVTTSNIDLVLKSGQTDNGGAAITGTTFHGVTFNSITRED